MENVLSKCCCWRVWYKKIEYVIFCKLDVVNNGMRGIWMGFISNRTTNGLKDIGFIPSGYAK
jgi:hypothetical protein